MPLETVGQIKSSLSGPIFVHYEPDTRKIGFTASQTHWVVTAKEAETCARVTGFLVVSGVGAALIFETESFKQNHPSFIMDDSWRTKYVPPVPPVKPPVAA